MQTVRESLEQSNINYEEFHNVRVEPTDER